MTRKLGAATTYRSCLLSVCTSSRLIEHDSPQGPHGPVAACNVIEITHPRACDTISRTGGKPQRILRVRTRHVILSRLLVDDGKPDLTNGVRQ